MPVNDDDDLLERASMWSYPIVAELADEVVALRAALAARPQPLFEGTIQDLWLADDDAIETTLRVVDGSELPASRGDRVLVYPVLAGSATPTGDGDGE